MIIARISFDSVPAFEKHFDKELEKCMANNFKLFQNKEEFDRFVEQANDLADETKQNVRNLTGANGRPLPSYASVTVILAGKTEVVDNVSVFTPRFDLNARVLH